MARYALHTSQCMHGFVHICVPMLCVEHNAGSRKNECFFLFSAFSFCPTLSMKSKTVHYYRRIDCSPFTSQHPLIMSGMVCSCTTWTDDCACKGAGA